MSHLPGANSILRPAPFRELPLSSLPSPSLSPRATTGLGIGPALRLTEASGGCRLAQETFAGTDGTGRQAPIPVTPHPVKRLGLDVLRQTPP